MSDAFTSGTVMGMGPLCSLLPAGALGGNPGMSAMQQT